MRIWEYVLQTRVVPGLFLALAWLGSASAHHSAAMFDPAKTVVLEGVVNQFRWTNPHTWLIVTVQTTDGKAQEWSVEMTSPNLLSRAGWRPTTIKPGEKIKVVGSPLRDGSSGLQFKCATLSDGRLVTYESISASPAAAGPVAACRTGNSK